MSTKTTASKNVALSAMNLQTFTGTAVTGKLKRSALLHYLDSTPTAAAASWFLIGQDIDDMSVELNPDTETVKNIWDENSVKDNGYEVKATADPYYAKPSDAIYDFIKGIALERKTGDDCKAHILEVIIDKTEGPFDAWQEDVIIKPQSYGGPQGGVNIPYDILFTGNRTKGTVTMVDKVPTFTPATA